MMFGIRPPLTIVALFAMGLPSIGLTQTEGQREYSQIQRNIPGPGFDPTPVQIPAVVGSAQRPITNIDLLSIRDFTGVQISPDGSNVAFVVSQAVYATNSYRTGLFVVGTELGSKPICLGSAGPPRWDQINQYSFENPSWSPDSRFVTYRLKRSGTWQIWRWDREGGEPVELTHSRYEVQSFEWLPDGSKIVFATEKPRDPEEARHLFERGILYDGNIQPWRLKSIVQAELDKRPKETETWIYDVVTEKERKATEEEEKRYRSWQENPSDHTIVQGKVSPDGKLLGYVAESTSGVGESAHKTNTWHLYVRPFNGGKSIEMTPGAYLVSEFWWSTDSSRIYFSQHSGDGRPPKLFVVSAGSALPRQILPGEDWIGEYSADAHSMLAACLRQNLTRPEEVAVVDLKTGGMRTLVNVNPEFENIQLSPANRIEWKNSYGESGFGYLVKPLKYEPGKTYPLIVTTYRAGEIFLRGAVGDEYPIQVFAANGFAVLDFDAGPTPNVNSGDFHGAMRIWDSPKASLEAALKALDEMGIVDPRRRGLTGLSHGAEIVEFTMSHTDLFQATIDSGAGARDPYFFYMGGKEWHERFAKWGLGGWPEGEASARWHELSPALNADRVRAPLLANTAESEFMGALQWFTSLELLGKPLEVFIYPNEFHIKNQPKHRFEIYERNLDWFKFWLKGEEDPNAAKVEQYARWRELRELQERNRTKPVVGKRSGSDR